MGHDQRFLAGTAAGRNRRKAPQRSSKRPRVGGPGHPTKPVQRRPSPSEVAAVATEYQQGRSLDDLAREFGVHRRTVADHLERLGIARRVNLPKLTRRGVERAISQDQAGDSPATVGKALSVDPSTVQHSPIGPASRSGHGPDAEGAPRKAQAADLPVPFQPMHRCTSAGGRVTI